MNEVERYKFDVQGYLIAQQSWSKTHIQPPEGVTLTPRQQLLFEPPYFHQRQSLFTENQ